MAGIVPLRRGSPLKRTPEREALAAAIAHRDAVAALRESIRSQETAAHDAFWESANRRDAADAVAKGAAIAWGKYQANLNAGGSDDAPITPRRARELLADAEDDLEVARALRDGIKVRVAEQESALQIANMRVGNAAAEVMRQSPAIRETVLKFERLQKELLHTGFSVQWLASQQFVSVSQTSMTPAERDAGREAAHPKIERILLDRLKTPPQSWAALFGNQPGGIPMGPEPWKAALDALMRDADAPLPEVHNGV